jgi:hypothetical protein
MMVIVINLNHTFDYIDIIDLVDFNYLDHFLLTNFTPFFYLLLKQFLNLLI